jgi:X-X-X-Leu-X-X-Gly heptad repeat protein
MPDGETTQISEAQIAVIVSQVMQKVKEAIDALRVELSRKISEVETAEGGVTQADFDALKSATEQIKNGLGELSTSVSTLTTKLNTASDEIRSIGGARIPHTPPTVPDRVGRAMTILELDD